MKIQFTDFKELKISVQRFGVLDFEKTIEIKQFEQGEGLDVDLSDVFTTNTGELFVILKDGSVRKTIIHIVDISSWWNKGWGYPKFHIYECKEIKKQRNMKRQHRYKASSRKDGSFYLIKKDEKWEEPLKICSYCLTRYNKQFNSDKTKQDFPLKQWIERPINNSNFSKVDLDICTIPNRYINSWNEISRYIRKRESYICQNCGQDFLNEECKKFLHVHHIDANKRNNTSENLKALCIECHSQEHNHGHIKQLPEYTVWLRSKCNPVNRRDY